MNSGTGYEKRDWQVKPVLLVVGGLVAIILIGQLSALVLLQASRRRRPIMASEYQAAPGVLPPQPRLQVSEAEDMLALRQEEESLLSGYSWVDRSRGVVRIPIERAMDLIAQRGLPTRSARP